MNGPTQDEARAEIAYRQDRVRKCFAEGRITCGGMRLEVSGAEVGRRRVEMERARQELDEAELAFKRSGDHSSEITYIRAAEAFEEAKRRYVQARAGL